MKFLKNALEFMKKPAIKFWRKVKGIRGNSKSDTDGKTVPMNKIPLELNEIICQMFWKLQLKNLNDFIRNLHTPNILNNTYDRYLSMKLQKMHFKQLNICTDTT
jgi:hypothetical protein